MKTVQEFFRDLIIEELHWTLCLAINASKSKVNESTANTAEAQPQASRGFDAWLNVP